MPIIRVPVKIVHTGDGGPGYNVWHVRMVSDDPADAGDLGFALDALETFYSDIRSLYPNSTRIQIGEGMIKDPLGSPEYVADDFRELVGTGGTTSASQLLALVVAWRTTSATRSGRGRTFIGPLGGTITEADGTPNNTQLAGLRTAANALVSASGGTNFWAFGVLSTKQGLLRDFTGSSVKDQFAYLSSRRD